MLAYASQLNCTAGLVDCEKAQNMRKTDFSRRFSPLHFARLVLWWSLLHAVVEGLVLLLAAWGIGATGWVRGALESYIGVLWSVPSMLGLPAVSGPIFVLCFPLIIWVGLYLCGFTLKSLIVRNETSKS